MKAFLFTLLTLLFINTVYSQKFEVGIQGGAVINSAPFNITPAWTTFEILNKSYSGLKSIGSLAAFYNINTYQLGVSYSQLQLSFYGKLDVPYGGASTSYYYNGDIILANPLHCTKLFLNKKFHFKKLCPYSGISIGYLSFNSKNDLNSIGEDYLWRVRSGEGYSLGLNVGCTYFISKHLGINAEINADYIRLKTEPISYNLFALPTTLGVHYRF